MPQKNILCNEHFNHHKEPLSIRNNLLCNGKIQLMLKVLYGTIDANKEPCVFNVFNAHVFNASVHKVALFIINQTNHFMYLISAVKSVITCFS